MATGAVCMADRNPQQYVESTESPVGRRESMHGSGDNGLDLICTKLAIDFQCLNAESVEERIVSGLQSMTDASGADSVFIAVFDMTRRSIERVYAGHASFAMCNPEVLTGRRLTEFPWLAARLGHLRLVDIVDTADPGPEQSSDADELARLRIAALTAVGFNIGAQVGGLLGVASAAPHPEWSADFLLALKLISVSCSSGFERIRLSDELETLQERNRLVTETGNDGLWDYDVRNNSMYFSPRWRSMLGYASDEDIPDWRYLVHPDDIARVQRQLREHLEGATPLFDSVHRMRHANGDWRWIECRVQGRVDEHGRAIRLVGIETDITERKLYEEALFREKESAQITLQSIGDGVVTTDIDSNVQYLNPVAEGLTGWELDDAVGASIDEIFRGFHEETCEPDIVDSQRRKRALYREHGSTDSQCQRQRNRRCPRVS